MLSSNFACGSAGKRQGSAIRALIVLVLTMSGSAGCIWLDDFGKFKIGDAGARFVDAGTDSSSDASADSATSERCKEGSACFDGDPCTVADTCKQGKCTGEALDCSALNDDCSQGVCDPATGGCAYGPTSMSNECDDLNACTVNDRCTDDPEDRCRGEQASAGTRCDDFKSCTGTDSAPDECDDQGRCQSGAAVAEGTLCDDDNECTASDKCDGEGFCTGDAVRDGEPCQQACTSNTTCREGECVPDADEALAYNNQCLFSFCGISNICQEKWKTDLVCHCGCGYEDPACSACSPYMCQTLGDHKAARWCDTAGKPASNCPDSLKDDGKCDCGCQFADPDCNGGACCSGTGTKGCNDSFIEECVCERTPNGDRSCCDDEWTDRCAELAVNLGCMLCP